MVLAEVGQILDVVPKTWDDVLVDIFLVMGGIAGASLLFYNVLTSLKTPINQSWDLPRKSTPEDLEPRKPLFKRFRRKGK